MIGLFLSSQSDVVHQSVFELIHTDDRALFRRQLHFALNPTHGKQDGTADCPGKSSQLVRCSHTKSRLKDAENDGFPADDQNSAEISSNVMTYDPQAVPPENSSFLERNFCCRFRCLLDNSSGFLVRPLGRSVFGKDLS